MSVNGNESHGTMHDATLDWFAAVLLCAEEREAIGAVSERALRVLLDEIPQAPEVIRGLLFRVCAVRIVALTDAVQTRAVETSENPVHDMLSAIGIAGKPMRDPSDFQSASHHRR